MVSAFVTASRLVLGQGPVTDKSNELTAIPKLLQRQALDDLDQVICIAIR